MAKAKNVDIKERIELAKRLGSKKWTAGRLRRAHFLWKLFYQRKGVVFNLPGPTSDSHPFGFIGLPENVSSIGTDEINAAMAKVFKEVRKEIAND